MAARATLTALVLARNEAERIERCLERLAWADEVLVIDDLSTDGTAELCRRRGARVLQRPLDTFSAQANFGLAHARGDWVLLLDADELMSLGLRAELEQLLAVGSPNHAFTFKRLNFYLGHRMRFGGSYHDILRLLRRGAGRFHGRVHMDLETAGPIGRLEGHLEHYPFQSITQFINRQNRYSSLEAEQLRDGPAVSLRRLRQELTVRPLKLWWKSFFKKHGYREGRFGLVFSVLYAWVHFLRWAKCYEASQAQDAGHLGDAPERARLLPAASQAGS